MMATCGFTDNAFHQFIRRAVTDAAKEWAEVWVEDSTSLVLDLGRGAGHRHNFVRQSLHLRSRYRSIE